LVPFCGIRADLINQDENEDPTSSTMASSNTPIMNEDFTANAVNEGIGLGDLKRNRDDVFGDWADDEETASMEVDSSIKPIAALPKRSSPMQSSGFSRTNAYTLPVGAGLSSYLASGQDADWSAQDFSAFTNKSDF
jgi:hypothetical protein